MAASRHTVPLNVPGSRLVCLFQPVDCTHLMGSPIESQPDWFRCEACGAIVELDRATWKQALADALEREAVEHPVSSLPPTFLSLIVYHVRPLLSEPVHLALYIRDCRGNARLIVRPSLPTMRDPASQHFVQGKLRELRALRPLDVEAWLGNQGLNVEERVLRAVRGVVDIDTTARIMGLAVFTPTWATEADVLRSAASEMRALPHEVQHWIFARADAIEAGEHIPKRSTS